MTATTSAPWRAVALPAEHGGWGFVLEPILLGLLVAPTPAGSLLAVGVLASFLARTPLKIVGRDSRRRRWYGRTRAAALVLAVYGALLAAAFLGAGLIGGWQPLLPLLVVAPLVAIQLYFDIFANSRALLPELLGPVSLAAAAAGMALAAGWSWAAALGLWVIPVLHAVPSIFYIRTRLRQGKNQPVSLWPSLVAHLLAIGAGLALAAAGLVPWLTVVALILLLGRAVYFLALHHRPLAAKTLGWTEMVFTLMNVVLAAIGYSFGI